MDRFTVLSIKKQSGFTLIESILVLVFFGLILALVMLAYTQGTKASRDNKRKHDLQLIADNLEKIRQSAGQNNQYPADAVAFQGLVSPGQTYAIADENDPSAKQPYSFGNLAPPTVPSHGAPDSSTPATIDYQLGYVCDSSTPAPGAYRLYINLESGVEYCLDNH